MSSSKKGIYAQDTAVPIDRSVGEIKRVLVKYECANVMAADGDEGGMITFRVEGRMVRFTIIYDDADEREKKRLWRCLLLSIKSKLEVSASGISILDNEFMANIVLPDNSLVGDRIRPMIEETYETGKLPSQGLALLLKGPSS